MLRVMVTGAGSGFGQAVAKALRLSALPIKLVFADIDPFNPSFYRSDEAVIIPRVEDAGALQRFVDIVKEYDIDTVIPGSTFDLSFFAEQRSVIEGETDAKVIVSPPAVIEVGADKWLTAEFLRESGLPHPKTFLPQSIDEAQAMGAELGYPLVVKPRFGRASRGFYVVKNENELQGLSPFVEQPVLQELIADVSPTLDREYTCSIVKLADGRLVGPFTARRALRGGQSWVVEVDHFTDLHPLLLAIGDALPIFGSLNVQLMVGANGPIPFEFNPRFSGTTAMRAHFGFNEPAMMLRHVHFGEDIEPEPYRRGYAFRYMDEIFVDNVGRKQLKAPFPRGLRHDWF